jgi:hypothetical protein
VEGLVNLNLMEDKEAGKANRGFAFLEMASHAVAAKALRLLTKGDIKFGAHVQAKVCKICLAGLLCKACVSAHVRGFEFVKLCAILPLDLGNESRKALEENNQRMISCGRCLRKSAQ